MRFDLKYTVALIAAIAGVIVPALLWQYDQKSKSLSIKLISSTELQSSVTTTIPDLNLTINGELIAAPILSLVEIINDGIKPIPTSDFESPLSISIDKESKLIRAMLISTEPINLKPILEVNNQTIKVLPLLLNPNDKLKISVLSSGGLPKFIASARISGVSAINIDQKFEEVEKKVKIAWLGMLSVIGFFSVFLLLAIFITSNVFFINFVSFLSSYVIGGFSYNALYEILLQEEFKITIFGYRIFLLCTLFFGIIILFKLRKWLQLKINRITLQTAQSPAP